MTISTVGSAGGRTYPDLVSAIAAFTAGGWTLDLYNDTEFASASTITISGLSTSITDFLTIRAAAGQGFKDYAGILTAPLRYDGGVARVAGVGGTGVAIRKTGNYSYVFNISSAWVSLLGLQLAHSGTFGSGQSVVNSGNTNFTIGECLAENSGSGGTAGTIHFGNGTAQLGRNTLVVNRAGGVAVASAYGGAICAGVMAVRPSDITASDAAFRSDSGTMQLTDCGGFGYSAFTNGAGSFSGSNNASDQAIGFGSGNQASKPYGSQFVNTLDASRDFTPKPSGSDLFNGVVDTTDIPTSTDMLGVARGGTTWTIGPRELAVVTTATFVPHLVKSRRRIIPRPYTVWRH